jgi:hypothetical protein
MPKWVIALLVAGPIVIIGLATTVIMRSGNSNKAQVADVSNAIEKKPDVLPQAQVQPQNQHQDDENRLTQLEIENQKLKSQIANQNSAPILPAQPTPVVADMHDDYAKACEPLLECLDKISSDFQVLSPASKISDDVSAANTARQAWKRNVAVVKSSYPSKQELDDSFNGFADYEAYHRIADEESASMTQNGFSQEQDDGIKANDKKANDGHVAGLKHLNMAKKLLASGQ